MTVAARRCYYYGIVAISVILLICSSLVYQSHLTRKKYPMFSPESSLDHTLSFKHTTRSTRTQRKSGWSLLDINTTSSHPLPQIGSYQCRDHICSEFLSAKDRIAMHHCSNVRHPSSSSIIPTCHFMNGTHRSPVALVSFPGSGNTWVRGLLEKVTGICTGSEYCDCIIRNSGAIGERVTSGSVLVVKTHHTRLHFSKNTEGYGAAILLLRNPLQAIVSEWNRRLSAAAKLVVHTGSNSHVALLPEKYFRKNPQWQRFVAKAVPVWKRLIFNVLLNNGGYPVLTICYEDVLRSSEDEVKRMLDFLQVPYSNSDLKSRLAEDYSTFYRNHTSSFEHFTEGQKQLVRAGVNDVLLQLKQRKKAIPKLDKYLANTTLTTA